MYVNSSSAKGQLERGSQEGEGGEGDRNYCGREGVGKGWGTLKTVWEYRKKERE